VTLVQHMSYDAPINVLPFRQGGVTRSTASGESAMQVIAITGGKGGVGKTNIAVNLAVSMSMDGLDVMLFDADLGLANVDIVLGMQIKHTLADVVSGDKTLADVVVDGPEGLRVIPAASGVAQMVDMQSADQEMLIRQLSDQLMPPRCADCRYRRWYRPDCSNIRRSMSDRGTCCLRRACVTNRCLRLDECAPRKEGYSKV